MSYLHWPIIFCGFGLLFTAVELMRPARPLNYRAVIKNDLVALGIYGLLFLPVSIWLSRRLVRPDHVVLRSLLDLPLFVRLILYYVLADLGLYGGQALTQFAQVEFPPGLQPDHEEEEGHQAAVHPPVQIQRHAGAV